MRYVIFFAIGTLLIVGYFGTTTKPESTETESKIQITEDEIREYVSVSGASQEITVQLDTTWIKTTYLIDNTIFGRRFNYGESKKENTLKDKRVWRITAGIDGEITMRFAIDTVFLQLDSAKILHIEELQNKYAVTQVGEWNAKDLHEITKRSCSIAIATANANAIKQEAFANVAKYLAFKMPVQTVVNGIPVLQKNANPFTETKQLTVKKTL